jgi:NYN domain
MPPNQLKTIVLFDGQNLYHGAKTAWCPDPPVPGSPYSWPCYDVEALTKVFVERKPNRILAEIRFYTGVPTIYTDYFWHHFWNNKLRFLSSRGIYVYRGRVNPGGQEKGVDVSLATDLIWLTYEKKYDLAIIVSQDWDFGPAVGLAKKIARDQNRVLQFESAFIYESGRSGSPRGVPGTDWLHIPKAVYDNCRDATDYRPMPVGGRSSSS